MRGHLLVGDVVADVESIPRHEVKGEHGQVRLGLFGSVGGRRLERGVALRQRQCRARGCCSEAVAGGEGVSGFISGLVQRAKAWATNPDP